MAPLYKTLDTVNSTEFELKKSRFIGIILPCRDESQAIQQLDNIVKMHPSANHLAYAWRLRKDNGQIFHRQYDGGEPSGTAGRPILAPLEGDNIINVVIGVIRYFGGVKLGTGGLTRAYGQAAKLVIKEAQLVPWVDMIELVIKIEYGDLQSLNYQLGKINGQILKQKFGDKVELTLECPKTEAVAIKKKFSVI